MPVISFLSGKGGVGKTTSAMLLAFELAQQATVSVIELDSNAPWAMWIKTRDGDAPFSFVDHKSVSQENIDEVITKAAATSTFVIVDCEGVRSMINAYAAKLSDLVIIPTQASLPDAVQAAAAIKLAQSMGRGGAYKLLWTRSAPAIRSRTQKEIEDQFEHKTEPFFQTRLIERDAYRAMQLFGQTLHELNKTQVPNIEKAQTNALSFARETVDALRAIKEGRAV